jgi:hypothetical protein
VKTHRIVQVAQLVALVVALAAVPVAFAAKGGGGGNGGKPSSGSSSLSIQEPLVYDANGDGVPNWGDTLTFNISQTATTEPYVDLTCSQNGVVVYGATAGFFASYPWPWTVNMKLGSQMWTGGNAACTAVLYMFYGGGKKQTLAKLSFTGYA